MAKRSDLQRAAAGALPESEAITRELAASALRKRQQGLTPNPRETAALKDVEKQHENEQRWRYYHSVPKSHYTEMAGRPTKILHEQAARYGLPLVGPTIDLPLVIHGVHDLLAKLGRRYTPQAETAEQDPLLDAVGNSPALERYRDEKAKIAKLDRLERERVLLRVDLMHSSLVKIGSLVREAGERLQRKYGREAQEILDECLDAAMEEIERTFAAKPTETHED